MRLSDANLPNLRSVSDLHLFVVCRDGGFYETVPEHVRQQGPWQGMHRGKLANLNTQYLLDIEEHGYGYCTVLTWASGGVISGPLGSTV